MANPDNNKPKGIHAFMLSFKYAFNGIYILISTQRNARVHLLAAVLVVAAGFYFSISNIEWVAVILCIVMVLATEAFNTAIEKIVDEISPEFNSSAGKIKDLAAGAVLFTAVGAAVVGLIIFVPRLL
jgi:diacylglycerol kinase (ATP)